MGSKAGGVSGSNRALIALIGVLLMAEAGWFCHTSEVFRLPPFPIAFIAQLVLGSLALSVAGWGLGLVVVSLCLKKR